MFFSTIKLEYLLMDHPHQQTIATSNVRRSSQIPVWRVIRFDRCILSVSYNSIDKFIGWVTALCHPTDFQTSQVLRSV